METQYMVTLAQILDSLSGNSSLNAEVSINAEASSEFLNTIQHQSSGDVLNKPFSGLCLDSRNVQSTQAFVLLKSAVNHSDERSIQYAHNAANKCAFILSEVDLNTEDLKVAHVYLPNIRQILGSLQASLLQMGKPVSIPKVMAVTGTNGKTSIATIAAQIMTAHFKVALMGTAGNGIYPKLTPATHTTTDVLALHSQVHSFATQNADVLCLEASSHGLHQHRLQGLPIQLAVFSNLSRDHLDYHQTMDEYAQAKSLLFSKQAFPQLNTVVINTDDAYAPIMMNQAKQNDTCTVWTYSFKDANADFYIEEYTAHATGVDIVLQTPFGKLNINSPLLGHFNIANLTAAIASSLAMGVNVLDIPKLVASIKGVTGRMQAYVAQGVTYVVDYAHTPDAISQVIESLRMHATSPNSQIMTVFGCGGDRDKGKRPLMMQAALNSDHIIVTADNPRSEEPTDIIYDMVAELSTSQKNAITIEPDRKMAIKTAINNAKQGDIVLLAGKGHETYQEIKGVRYDFDDMAVLKELLNC